MNEAEGPLLGSYNINMTQAHSWEFPGVPKFLVSWNYILSMLELQLPCHSWHQDKPCVNTIHWHNGQYNITSYVSWFCVCVCLAAKLTVKNDYMTQIFGIWVFSI